MKLSSSSFTCLSDRFTRSRSAVFFCHLAVEVFVLAFEQAVLFLNGFFCFGELGVYLLDVPVTALEHEYKEAGKDGDDSDGEVEVALLFDD